MAKVEKKLQNYLILNKYMCSLFGFKNIEDFRDQLKNISEGTNDRQKLIFTENLQTLNLNETFKQKLNEYDENIQTYLIKINEKRDPPLVLKYYQYLAILFTEIYLDKYFNDFDNFFSELTTFVLQLNTKERKTGIQTYSYPSKDNMRKLAYWSATGSGKTILMHINILQIQKYNNKRYENFLLITPNEGLTAQHVDELNLSSIDNKKFEVQKTLDDWSLKNPLKVIDIHKIKFEVTSKEQNKTVPVEAFGGNNILFVDEGHKGNSSDAQTWKNIRRQIVGDNGFTFEYSATFGEINYNRKDTSDTFNEYSSSIIFDYRYKYFYEDGFGKDYSIMNLTNEQDYGDEYFTGAILSLYEQKIYFQKYNKEIKSFNLENPLMIFVGSSVTGKKSDSDVLKVIQFIARFVNERNTFSTLIENILNNKSTIEDDGESLFDQKFPYLRKLKQKKQLEVSGVYDNILKILFHTGISKTLQLIELKNANGEIGLKFDKEYFAIINIGKVNDFIKLVNKENEDQYFYTEKTDNFEKSLFRRIEHKNSKINFLIGSKKFIEGWNCYRVSSMVLLNIGKSEGTQIIQLFGRGVRLRGYNNFMKRSYVIENELPENIEPPSLMTLLETLNIFGLNAKYMEVFKNTLREEGIEQIEKIILKIIPTFPQANLYVPRLNEKNIDFKTSVNIDNLNEKVSEIKLDLSSKINIFESEELSKKRLKQIDSNSSLKYNKLNLKIVELLNINNIFIELLKYKDLKKYYNFYFNKNNIKELLLSKNYSLYCKDHLIELFETDELNKLEKIENYIIQILKTYIDKIYTTKKYKWYQENLTYETVSEEDNSLIPKEYIFTINSEEKSFIKNLNEFSNSLRDYVRENYSEESDLNANYNSEFRYEQNKILEFFTLNIHLFKPLIYKTETKENELKFLNISPIQLVKSERDFIKLIQKYIENNQDIFDEIYFLRNPSRKGIGFFETKNFYPDFILWTIKDNKQTISFIDPKGLIMVDSNDEKLKLFASIKNIEKELNEKTNLNIKLFSFIVTPTSYDDLKKKGWTKTKQELNSENILFIDDGESLVQDIFSKISDNIQKDYTIIRTETPILGVAEDKEKYNKTKNEHN